MLHSRYSELTAYLSHNRGITVQHEPALAAQETDEM
jgi:hypothetical protein